MKTLKIVGIYLAAGKSSRFGKNKLLVPFNNVPLGSHALQSAIQSKLDKVIVVTKANDPLHWLSDKIKASGDKWIKKECIDAKKGQSYSLKCGISSAEKLQADAVIVMLADQPFVTTSLINKFIQLFNENSKLLFVGATNNEIISPPFFYHQVCFPKFNT